MPGQPQIPGWLEFDVVNLQVREIQEPPPAHAQNIIDYGEPFELILTFKGSGDDWINMKRQNLEYQACFYVEGLGQAAPELDLGCVKGRLNPANDTYDVIMRVPNGIQARGVFKCAAVVEFPNKYGVLGFFDDLLIQVSIREEYG